MTQEFFKPLSSSGSCVVLLLVVMLFIVIANAVAVFSTRAAGDPELMQEARLMSENLNSELGDSAIAYVLLRMLR